MTRQVFILILLNLCFLTSFAQKTSITGNVKDVKLGETLIGASVYVEGTTIGTVTDFDGNYILNNVPVGTINLVCSFISYEKVVKENIKIVEGDTPVINFEMGESAVKLNDVVVIAKANRESEVMLLIDQKKSVGIKQSIGSQELSSQGVSDAASAASKISGVTKNEDSGSVYVRGLGDRYLSTTMNGLPIPSDDVEKKNIDLKMFETDIIKNVGISKTYSVDSYADQSSGTIDISSKTYSDKISIGLKSKINTNVLKDGVFNAFKATQNYKDQTLGFYSKPYSTEKAITNQSWGSSTKNLPIGYEFSLLIGKKLKVFKKDLSVFATVSQSSSSEYFKGIYQKFRTNSKKKSFVDAEEFKTKISSTALLNMTYDLHQDHQLSFNSLWVHKTTDKLYESGRNGEGYVRDQDPQEEGAFVRDQNLKQTALLINQLLGSHKLGSYNQLNWAVAYNSVRAEEPNRIRNEVNILDENTVQFAHVGDLQQKKSSQNIKDSEINGYLKNVSKLIDQDDKKLKLIFGANFRKKERDFDALSLGVRAKGVKFQVSSIDHLDETLLNTSLYGETNADLRLRVKNPDVYTANLDVIAGYVSADFQLNRLSGDVGIRYENDEIKVVWDVANYIDPVTFASRVGEKQHTYTNVLPVINLKYQLNDKNSIRLAASKTITLPEFKELAPFEYVSQDGDVYAGNPELKSSENYNFDLKWEMFPTAKQLVSISAFYKLINDPINKALQRGSSGYFYYANTGDKAIVYGFEFETRLALIKAKMSGDPKLDVTFNATKMWLNQDLLDEFQYNNKTESGLEGASDLILNGVLSFSNNKEHEFKATVAANYSSDKIFVLGSPESFANRDVVFNNEIIEKGFVSMDMVISKKVSDRFSVKLSVKNLLNPKIEQTQNIEPTKGEGRNEIVKSYKKGINLSLGLKINLN